jgi:acyl-CoA thioesterase-1
MQKIFILLFLLLSPAMAFAAGPPAILVFGDSLSAGYGMAVDQSWPSLLQQRLESEGYEYRVVNASITGETTQGGAARIASAVERFQPALLIVELGGNDGLRGLPTERMYENLQKIIAAGRSAGAGVVLLGIRIPLNYGARYSSAFEAVFEDLAKNEDVAWVEFFMRDVALEEELMQADGIHPNVEAQPILLDNAWPAIIEALAAPRHANQQAAQ